MGGRGSSTGISDKNKPYGSEYKTLLTYGNIKFVVSVNGNATAPMETMTKRRVYVTLDYKGDLKFISYNGKGNIRCKQIDLHKFHNGVSPHVHHGYIHNEYDSEKGFSHLTPKEMAMVDRVTKIWEEKKDVVWNKWTNSHR